MSAAKPYLAAIKKSMRAAWMAGDFGKIADLNTERGEDFVERLNLKPGMRALDVGCGTGNQSIPAARRGASVTALDHAPNLLQQAENAARKKRLKIHFVGGDAEELPFRASEFDVVFSMFGAMFAPRPNRVIEEVLRVCKRGGLIALASWTPASFQGAMLKINERYSHAPKKIPAPELWGDETVVRRRFGARAQIETAKRELVFRFPVGPGDVVDLFSKYFGPIQVALARLDRGSRSKMLDELKKHWAAHNEGDAAHTVVRGEYLEIHARPI